MEIIKIHVVVPTSKRWSTITTPLHVKHAIVCVPESELTKYQFYHPNYEYVTHPDTVVGLAPKRNWIYEKFGNVLMLDDDLKGLYRMYVGKRETVRATPTEAYEIIQYTGNIAHMMGVFLFGFSNNPRPVFYDSMRPFQLTGFINGAAIGLLEGSGLEFIKETTAVEDFYMSALNAYVHRKCFIDTRFNFQQDGYANNPGGQAQHRTNETEQADTLLLRKKFGEAITLKKGNSLARNTNRFGRGLKIPF